MTDDVYRKLARNLDTIPNGFPSTESGVELWLLQRIFEPEEAAIASVMRLTYEPATDIAARAGFDPKIASRVLKGMVRKGQIRATKGDSQLLYRLMPFVVGIYEEQLPRMDVDLAELFQHTTSARLGGLAMIACCCCLGFPLGVSTLVRFGQTGGRVQR